LRDIRTSAARGQAAARKAATPASFRLQLLDVQKIPPKASRARKDQINHRRSELAAQARAQGAATRRKAPR
jgi:hypothetical protein